VWWINLYLAFVFLVSYFFFELFYLFCCSVCFPAPLPPQQPPFVFLVFVYCMIFHGFVSVYVLCSFFCDVVFIVLVAFRL